MVIGTVYIVYLTISLFIDSINKPVTLALSQAMIFGTEVDISSGTLIICLYYMTAFISSIICIVLAAYISYYKSVIKVDA